MVYRGSRCLLTSAKVAQRVVSSTRQVAEVRGDFEWYDPSTKSPLSAETAHALWSNPREMSEHQLMGYILEPNAGPREFITAEEEFEEPQFPQ